MTKLSATFRQFLTIASAMTPEERTNPSLVCAERLRRVSRDSGVSQERVAFVLGTLADDPKNARGGALSCPLTPGTCSLPLPSSRGASIATAASCPAPIPPIPNATWSDWAWDGTRRLTESIVTTLCPPLPRRHRHPPAAARGLDAQERERAIEVSKLIFPWLLAHSAPFKQERLMEVLGELFTEQLPSLFSSDVLVMGYILLQRVDVAKWRETLRQQSADYEPYAVGLPYLVLVAVLTADKLHAEYDLHYGSHYRSVLSRSLLPPATFSFLERAFLDAIDFRAHVTASEFQAFFTDCL